MTARPITLHLSPYHYHVDIPPYADRTPVGCALLPMFTHIATPADLIGGYDRPENTDGGIVCGDCSSAELKIRHASVDHVRACWSVSTQEHAEYLSELPLIRAGWL